MAMYVDFQTKPETDGDLRAAIVATIVGKYGGGTGGVMAPQGEGYHAVMLQDGADPFAAMEDLRKLPGVEPLSIRCNFDDKISVSNVFTAEPDAEKHRMATQVALPSHAVTIEKDVSIWPALQEYLSNQKPVLRGWYVVARKV